LLLVSGRFRSVSEFWFTQAAALILKKYLRQSHSRV
jgi:hypothetical protein